MKKQPQARHAHTADGLFGAPAGAEAKDSSNKPVMCVHGGPSSREQHEVDED